MNRPNFDIMTKHEQRQCQACFNEYLGQQIAAQARRKIVTEAEQKEELEIEQEQEF